MASHEPLDLPGFFSHGRGGASAALHDEPLEQPEQQAGQSGESEELRSRAPTLLHTGAAAAAPPSNSASNSMSNSMSNSPMAGEAGGGIDSTCGIDSSSIHLGFLDAPEADNEVGVTRSLSSLPASLHGLALGSDDPAARGGMRVGGFGSFGGAGG